MGKTQIELAAMATVSAGVAVTFHATHRPGWVVATIAILAGITALGAVFARPDERRG